MVRYVLSLPDGLDVLVIDNEVQDECGLQLGVGDIQVIADFPQLCHRHGFVPLE